MLAPYSRLLLSGTCFLMTTAAVIATEKPAEAASRKISCDMGSWGLCASGPVGGGSGHEFGDYGGMFYCFPNSCHGDTQTGLCQEWHVECDLT